MSLYDYFMRPGSVLPKPDSSLSTVIPASTIVAANEEVKKVISANAGEEDTVCSSRRGAYEQFTLKGKARIGKRAAEHSVTATVLFLSKAF